MRTATTLLLLGVLLGLGPGTGAAFASPASATEIASYKYDRDGDSSPVFWALAGVVVVGGIAYNVVRFRRSRKQNDSDE
ncbi:hypothetical protein [Streptomyces sp. HNM0574]|uniref:hypothetical protein n=1 Tax=Streptomyces sp. HNM0574 TaxID=2714954 RepID=UPI00146F2A27|nr:hypothetical protein [Streptomyces sp. HNM0574]NLU68250.1 hypothetical protein [Streptomyces sp. HNM0574]